MYKYWLCALLFRIVFPCAVASAVFIRPTITSYVYMVMGCYMPFYSVPTNKSMAHGTGFYMKLLIIVCLIMCTMVFSLYFILYFWGVPEANLAPCSTLEVTVRTIGIVDFGDLPLNDAVTWCLPEPLMLATSLALNIIFKKMTRDNEIGKAKAAAKKSFLLEVHHKKLMNITLVFGKCLVCILLCLTSILKATILGLIYYIVFLGILTYWACNRSLGKVFARILVCLTPLIFLHITIIFCYQFQYFQDSETFETTSIWGRLFSLVNLKSYKDCKDPKLFKLYAQNDTTYALVFCLFFLYHMNILVARQIFGVKDGIINLVYLFFYYERGSAARWRRALIKLKKQIEDTKLRNTDTNLLADKFRTAMEYTEQFMISMAYLIGNFIMMIWAIVYIGWPGLILLIWANIIWLLPSRKQMMLMMSPFLVVFMQILLLKSYLFSMDLSREELPSKIGIFIITSDVNGPYNEKWRGLLKKSLFGAIIFVTMRQLWQEKATKRQEMELAKILEGTSVELTMEKENMIFSWIDRIQKRWIEFFALWWIWIVIITMIWIDFWSTSNLFKIVFVGLAMVFLLTFQLRSFTWWKKFLQVYWWIVITYAMFNLFVVYMYQISDTRMFLHKYISETSFKRFGFTAWTDGKELFAELAKPLFFQIAIVIQQNYLQNEFNRLTSPTSPEEVKKLEKETAEAGTTWKKIKSTFRSLKDTFFAVLEVHLQNVTLLVGWYMCLFDICAFFAPFVLLFTAACVLGRRFSKQVIYLISVSVQVLIVARLVYMNQCREHEKLNYVGYYITLIYASIVMGLRMDAIAIPISFWLLLMFSLNRKWMKRLWLPGVVVLAVLVPLQYVTTLGLSPSLFEKTLTKFWNSNDFLLRLQQFCYIMNMAHPPAKRKISLDFMLLLIMSRQWLAFKMEWKLKDQDSAPGSNKNVSHLLDNPDVNNPVPDFITYTKNYLDDYKKIFFTTWFYLSLTALFLAGSMRPTLYSFGYLLGAFIFLWEGSDFFLRPAKSILFRWNIIIAYIILIMITRSISQIFGCILKYESSVSLNCAVYRLFTIGCIDKYGMTENVPNVSKETSCEVEYELLGMGWDCFAFFCLIWQQRIFKSFHFFHIVNNVKIHTILGHRGAELIENNRWKKRQAIDKERITIENNINKKIERIEANSKKIEAIRSGEYYLFDEVEKDIDIPLLPPKEEEKNDYDPYDPMPLTEFLGLLYATDMKTVLDVTATRSRLKKAIINKSSANATKEKLKSDTNGKDLDNKKTFAKTIDVIRFLWGLFESFVVTVIGLIDQETKVFRSVLNEIDKEKRILKEKTNFSQGKRLGSNKIWYPAQSYGDILNNQRDEAKDKETLQRSIYFKLLRAVWYLVMYSSEWLCYIIIILNQVLRRNFISLPLVIMILCWGALTVPKPTKTFWIITIAYELIMVFIKNFFHMGLVPWSEESFKNDLFFPPVFIGLRNKNRTMNLLLLVVLFFHRIVLQELGLWKPFDYRVSTLMKDGDYYFRNRQLVPINTSGSGKNQEVMVTIKNEKIAIGDYFPTSIFHGLIKYAEGFRLYVQQLVSPSSTQIPVDVYTPMFWCDLVNMFLLMFYFGSFQKGDENMGVLEFITNNRVPLSFIVVILMYIFLMMIDRGLYLRKNRFGKLIYHFFQVFGFHIWLFIVYPMTTNRRFTGVPVLQTFYVLKCFYFLFSAYQIRNGYPVLISQHYLWHGYTFFHRFGYKIYRFIPYFLEIRCLFDWICSDSCLAIPAWFKMEDITQTFFDARCQQEFDEKWFRPASQRQNRTMKYLVGGFLYAVLILTIIFPFLLFSLSSTMGVVTYPSNVKMEMYMGSAEPIFESFADPKDRTVLSQKDYENISTTFNNIKVSEEIFGSFKYEDVLVMKWSSHSLTNWDISPGSKEELLKELRSDEPFLFHLELHYSHIGHGGAKSHKMFGQNTAIPDPQRETLIDMIENGSNAKVSLALIFPKFLRITKEGTPIPLTIMENPGGQDRTTYAKEIFDSQEDNVGDLSPDPRRLRNLLITLQSDGGYWWQITEECTVEDDNYQYYLKNLVHNHCNELTIYFFNEKVFSQTMQYMTQSGILGLYLVYFMMVIEVIRSCLSDVKEIWTTVLPNSKKLLRKCMEVYVARDTHNYQLERDIFEDLIFIMRSRELFIKLTRFEDTNYNATFITPGT